MEYITTTNLRTKSSQLVNALKKGSKVSLIHRSQIIATIEPIKYAEAPPVTAEKLRAFIKKMKPQKLIPRSRREEIYSKHLKQKYGKGLS